ncbi:MAG: hypothetical protein FD153_1031 [Rhodospirillaceae bacterium]|nr:MAG: hypothetical protein FD153_1031 [Rhodospirillaceae bacterium]
MPRYGRREEAREQSRAFFRSMQVLLAVRRRTIICVVCRGRDKRATPVLAAVHLISVLFWLN